jgi:metal-responsive CopG/Arc/MetJ family transcriptional regulator
VVGDVENIVCYAVEVMAGKTRVIQVPMSRNLVDELDEVSREREQSRAALIRELCERFLKAREEERLDREYAEGYKRMPETEEEKAWAEMGAKLLAEGLAEDAWPEDSS